MSDKRVHHLRPLREVKPPERHLENVLREAETFFDQGEFSKGLSSMSHAVFVAATTGPQGMENHELIHRLRKIAGWGYSPDGEAA